MHTTPLDDRLRERLLLSRAAPGDRLMLADATLLAALDGSRALTPKERTALQQSPLTMRRFRQLALDRRAAGVKGSVTTAAPVPHHGRPGLVAANDASWHGSAGMLRAAASSGELDMLSTDDQFWALHFLPEGDGWQVVLKLAGEAPFAARLLRERTMLRVVDGGGAIVLQGRLDADGECEQPWPFATAPAPHFHMYGARFAVEPVAP
ncbi:hypothetical protein [Rugamonas apoptosis]|uniref:Uncharacterized protein n=1 Tax=Rugamonas apoptosis TaxID=2758570 RepID=A0A7W2FA42_9BURK|nr:hypothetical protein [Rugamonas apoptosis]MBA5687938.1 hypothetical protein [Rugamonas apoptosis]